MLSNLMPSYPKNTISTSNFMRLPFPPATTCNTFSTSNHIQNLKSCFPKTVQANIYNIDAYFLHKQTSIMVTQTSLTIAQARRTKDFRTNKNIRNEIVIA